jgi:hypothetical protein
MGSWIRFRPEAILLLAGAAGVAQTLTPREIFYGQHRAEAKPRPHRTTPAPAKEAAPAEAAPAEPAPPEVAPAEPAPPEAAPSATSVETREVEPRPTSARRDYVSARYVAPEAHPLAMRYSVRKLEGGSYSDVDADAVFHAGDHIALAIETNDSGYLYVVAQGSSGRWEVSYPTEKVSGSNRVEKGRTYKIPPGADEVLTFHPPAGTERLFVVLTRQPLPDLEKLIYSLQNENSAPKEANTMLAQNFQPIDDSVVQGLRTTYSRDLVIEKVGDSKVAAASAPEPSVPPERLGEKAVYVVNMNADDKARVVADIALNHE